MLAFLFSILIIKCNCRESYIKSIFGHPGTDEVENEWVDGFEVLQTGLPIPKRKHIKEAHYTNLIQDEDYPNPNHDVSDSVWPILREETRAVHANFNNMVNITQDRLYWHPAAPLSYFTTQEDLDKAPRCKVKFTIQPKYKRHVLPAFLPPGESITVEIPESILNQMTITINNQCKSFDNDTPNNRRRLNNPQFNIKLTNKTNHIGSPYGGSITVYITALDPIDIYFTGVILQPYFYYGMNSDEEWENDLSKKPGPFAYFDTGNLVQLGPANQIRNTFRMNDCMHYWRSALQISQTTAKDYNNYGNSQFGRIDYPCVIYYDIFVPYGAACSYTTTNHIQAPPSWFPTTTIYENSINLPWGTAHEINHQHQHLWGYANAAERGEMTNNAVNLVTFAKTNTASSTRPTSGWGRYTYPSFMLNDQTEYGLAMYSTMIHFFGVEAFKKFVYSDQQDNIFPEDTYGVPGAEMLKASKACNRNLRYHYNFHNINDEMMTSKGNDTFGALNKMKLKPFHPVTSVYAVGIVTDGKDIITARPYRIIPIPQEIDFVSTMVQRENKKLFGDFEFKKANFESGRESAWKQISKGKYLLTPKEDILETEEVRVEYLDKTTNEVHTVICQFTTMHSYKDYAKQTRYGYIPMSMDNIFKAYSFIANNGTEENILSEKYINDGIASQDYSNGEVDMWICVLEGMIKVPSNGSYVFSTSADTQALFYLSEEELSGNPELDEKYLLNYQPSTQMSFDNANKSKPVTLDTTKYYHFRQVVYPGRGGSKKGRGWVGYKFNNQGNFEAVPSSWLRLAIVDEEKMFNNQFHPDFERIYEMDKWDGTDFLSTNQTKWNVYKYPPGSSIINSNKDQGESSPLSPTSVLTDDDATTDFRVNWWPANKAVQFPHIFEIDFGEMQSFKVLKMKGAGNEKWFGMNAILEIYLAPYNYSIEIPKVEEEEQQQYIPYSSDNYSINHEQSLIWKGNFTTQSMDRINFDKEFNGRYLKLKFINNTKTWKDGHPGRTEISNLEIGSNINNKKVYPMTNRKYISLTNRWDEYRGGAYYNGKGYTGYAAGAAPKSKSNENDNSKNSVITFRIPKLKPEFGIIGDYYPTMGTAIVKLDGEEVGIIGPNNVVNIKNDLNKLKKASRSYKSLLFYIKNLDVNKQHNITVEVTKGSITLAGILTHQMVVTYFTDDYRYQKILETEFDDNPLQFDWDMPTDEFLASMENKNKKKKGLSGGAIAAIVIVVILVVAAACVGVFIMYKKELLCFGSNKMRSSSAFDSSLVKGEI